MHRTISKEVADKAVAENASQIQAILENALISVIDAGQADNRNQAVGCMIDLGKSLEAAKALYDTAIFFHTNAG